MANTYKNIVITPNRDTDAANVPVIRFSGGNGTTNTDINVRVYTTEGGTLSFEGSAGQLLSITNDLTNSIFSVNDISGIPSIDVYANGNIYLAPYGGNVSIDSGTIYVNGLTNRVGINNTSPTSTLHVGGTLLVSQNNTSQLDVVGEIAEFAHNANTYAQIHVRNANTGTRASVDIVATADIGTDSTEFIDLGINSSTYNDPTFTISVAKDGYLYTSNGNITIGTANTNKSIVFFTGGTLAANERARIDPSGNLLINRTNSTVGQGVKLDINGAVNASAFLVNGVAVGGGGGVTSFSAGTTGFTPTTATTGAVTLAGTLAVANGGTGAANAATARTNLGLAIGTNVQAYSARLAEVASLATTSDNFIVANGTSWILETPTLARTSLGLGTIATQAASSVTITGGSITGITDLAVADGGTGAGTKSGARTNLGISVRTTAPGSPATGDLWEDTN